MTSLPANADLRLLSTRERDVVDLAVGGRTDEQIAQERGLSVSTVNSYWVRIRGKIGPLSRTEIVSLVLRTEFTERCARLESRAETLAKEVQVAREAESRAETALAAKGGYAWPFLALEALPCATLVVREPGIVAYANPQAALLIGRSRNDLIGQPLWNLTLGEDQKIWELSVRRFFEDPETRRASVGVKRAHYVVRGDGTNFRATAVAESFETSEGTMGIVTFREYLAELDAILGALRQPYQVI